MKKPQAPPRYQCYKYSDEETPGKFKQLNALKNPVTLTDDQAQILNEQKQNSRKVYIKLKSKPAGKVDAPKNEKKPVK